jgi:hypothetical protein
MKLAMITDPIISRALGYPYSIPDHDFMLDNGDLMRLEEGFSLENRTAVLAVGSNRSPEQLIRKFGNKSILPVTHAQLFDYDVVYAAHIASYGSIPAALAPSFGTIVSVSITWLTGLQLKRMHETEAIGINYDYGIASNLVFKTSTEHKIDAIGCYLGRHGYLNIDGNVIALQEIVAKNRIFKSLNQSEILRRICMEQSNGLQLEEWLKIIIDNQETRQEVTTRLSWNAIIKSLPAFKILDVKAL